MQRDSVKERLRYISKSQMIMRIKKAWPIAVMLGTLLIIFWPILFGDHTLYPSDIMHELFLPFSASRSGTNIQVTSILDYISGYFPMRYFLQQSLTSGDEIRISTSMRYQKNSPVKR